MPFTTLGDFSHAQGGATSIAPQASGAQASFGLVGNSVDLLGTEGIVSAWVAAGVTSGSPTNWTVTAKLQYSTDNSVWVDFSDGALPVIGPKTSATALYDVYVSSIQRYGRYARLVATVAFTGGTSPTVGVFGGIVAQNKIMTSNTGASFEPTTA